MTQEQIDKLNKKLKDSKLLETPKHYQGLVQPIDLIDAQYLNFNLGNVVKYVCRQSRKDSALEDLNKAMYYLQREINKFEIKNEK